MMGIYRQRLNPGPPWVVEADSIHEIFGFNPPMHLSRDIGMKSLR
jgi:hypothetical protein